MNKNISIITNFGCNNHCGYCVWKNHFLANRKDETDWNKLEKFLIDFQDKKKVSISGGGDPLYYFDVNKDKEGFVWFDKLFHITNQLNMKVDIHTRVKYFNPDFWNKINRVNFSVINIDNDIDFLKWLKNHTQVRIVYVVEKHTTNEYVEKLIEFSNKNLMQLTFKQLYGQDDNGRYDELKNKYNDQFFLDHDDYNIYYMPDNLVYDRFII